MKTFMHRGFSPLTQSTADVAAPFTPPARAVAISHYVALAVLVLAQLFSASALQPCLHSRRPHLGSNRLRSFTPAAFSPRALVLREKSELQNVAPKPPEVISMSPSKDRVAHYLQQRLGLNEAALSKMIQRQPSNLRLSIDNNLEPTLDYLQQRLDLDDAALSKLIQRLPALMGCSISDNLEPTLDYLQQRIDLDTAALSKTIQRFPSLLTISIIDNLQPTLNYLQERLDLDDAAFLKTIQRMPSLLTCSITDNLEPTLNYLQQRLELDNAALSKMVQRIPQLLGLSITDNVEPTLVWLQKRISLTDEGLSKLVQSEPTIVGLNVDRNMEPTLTFYIEALGDEYKALELVTKYPSVFNSSLEKRLNPRLVEARSAGLVIDAACLRRMAKLTKKDWDTSLAFQAERHIDAACVTRIGSYTQEQSLASLDSKTGNLEPTLVWLQKRLSLTDEGISKLVQSSPRIIGYNVHRKLEPTLIFYIYALGDEGKALELVIKSPNLFGPSLEKRLKPRLVEACNAGMIIDAACMKRIAWYNKEKWDAIIALAACSTK